MPSPSQPGSKKVLKVPTGWPGRHTFLVFFTFFYFFTFLLFRFEKVSILVTAVVLQEHS
jgi:hypothetical protein